MEKHVYFVRHGESDSNVDGVARMHLAMLSEKGKQQAAQVAKRIQKIGVEAIVSSPFPRTFDTAEAISKEISLPVETSELFVERRRPSAMTGRNSKDPESKKMMEEIFDGYAEETHRHSDEENFIDLRERVNAAFAFLEQHPKNSICVVTHGVFLRVLLCAAICGPEFSGKDLMNFIRSADTDNTGVSHFVLQEDYFSTQPRNQWIIKNWNDLAHLG